MADFFLSHKNATYNHTRIISRFNASGVALHRIFQLSNWELILFENKKTLAANFLVDELNRKTFICGTLIYKSLPLNDSLKQLHFDHYSKQIDDKALLGNFCVIFYNGKNINILLDNLGVRQIFQSEDGLVISTSFLAILQSSPKKFKINHLALSEKLATGFLIGEDTLVGGIKKASGKLPFPVPLNDVEIINSKKHPTQIESHNKGINKSIEVQIEILSSHFQAINNAFPNYQGDLGLSSGFDCRLILALANKEINTPLHIHSHNTLGVHDTEIFYAKQLAEITGVDLHLVPTQSLEGTSNENIEKVLDQNLYFFDGRTGRHLGAYSETYTPDYRKNSMGDAAYSLNGLGGEIFRDSYFLGNKVLNWDDWARRFLFYPLLTESLGSEKQAKDLSYMLKRKIEVELNMDFSEADLFKTHAYYGLVKMPQANGTIAQAYGKVSHFLFPFIEFNIVTEALRAIPYLGTGGAYQAKLISRISPELAAIGSHYGTSFDKLTLKYLLWGKLKTIGSVKTRNTLVRKKLLKRANKEFHIKLIKKINETPVLLQAKEAILSHAPYVVFDKLLLDNTQRRYIIYLGHFLNRLSPYFD
ncbi:MAG: hypothetical protein WCR58_04470 [Bacteroidales bacterium]|jgi:hypothetical protein|nr:hypothetical protein [Bacteroidales bacterium]